MKIHFETSSYCDFMIMLLCLYFLNVYLLEIHIKTFLENMQVCGIPFKVLQWWNNAGRDETENETRCKNVDDYQNWLINIQGYISMFQHCCIKI